MTALTVKFCLTEEKYDIKSFEHDERSGSEVRVKILKNLKIKK